MPVRQVGRVCAWSAADEAVGSAIMAACIRLRPPPRLVSRRQGQVDCDARAAGQRMMAVAGTRDIGVAIGIPEPFRTELQTWRERLGDPNAAYIAPHVTLLAPTAVPGREIGEIERHLAEVARRAAPFRIRLRGSGTFRPLSPVVFVALAMGISGCELLQEAVRSGPLARPLRFGYHPHVTVAHDIHDEGLDRAWEALADYEASFDVDGFGLYERGDDQVWRKLRQFRFGGRTDRSPGSGDTPGNRTSNGQNARSPA